MERFSARLCIEKSGESALFLLIGAALTIINMIKRMSQSCPSVWCQNKIWKAEWNCFLNGSRPKTMPVSGCSSKKDLRLPEAALSDSADQAVALTHAEFSARLMKKTYRDCTGTRKEERWGHVSTRTGRGQSHTRCLMKERWKLWQLGAARKKPKGRKHVKSTAISDNETFAAAASMHANGIQELSSLVLQLPNNAINPAILLLSSVMAGTDSPVVVMGTVVLSAGTVGVVEKAGVVVSAHRHTLPRSEVFTENNIPSHLITVKGTLISFCLFCRLVYVEFRLQQGGPGNADVGNW